MKVYRIPAGTYFEKQDDAKKADRRFEAVEFPFAASPKADFVDWLNDAGRVLGTAEHRADLLVNTPVVLAEARDPWAGHEGDPMYPLPVAQPLPTQPDPAHAARSIALDEAWDSLPFGQKAHFASLFCEEAREKLR